MSRKVVVTGAGGYIGSCLVKSLVEDGWDVYVILREQSQLTLLDEIQNSISICRYNGKMENLIECFENIKEVDMVIHLASLFLVEHSYEQVDKLLKSNIQFGTHILEAMRAIGCKYFINTSTAWQHYQNENYNPVCLYAATKEAFEKILDYYVQGCRISSITLELFETYGENDPRRKIINLLKECYQKNRTLEMSLGEQELDFVYIDDVVNAYKQAMHLVKKQGVVHYKYSITSQNPITLKELVECIEKVIGQKLNIIFGAKPYREREMMTTWKQGVVLPMWDRKYTLERGLKQVFEKIKKE